MFFLQWQLMFLMQLTLCASSQPLKIITNNRVKITVNELLQEDNEVI